VEDPYGGPPAAYQQAAVEIRQAVLAVLDLL
jgi:hypothetical protein